MIEKLITLIPSLIITDGLLINHIYKKNKLFDQAIEERKQYQIANNLLMPYSNKNCFNYKPTTNVKKQIREILYTSNFPIEFINDIEILINYLCNDRLILCMQNIETIKLQRKQHHKLAIFDKDRKIGGYYNFYDNQIVYYDISSLGHEILHMASATDNSGMLFSGFERFDGNTRNFQGLNEGYTELLNRRIFHNKEFQTNVYPINVFLIRMLELLFSKNELENAYFHNNTEFIYQTFLKYGTKEEFLELVKYLDFFCQSVIIPEDKEMIELLKSIVQKTHNPNRIKAANNIAEEYDYLMKPKVKRFFNL